MAKEAEVGRAADLALGETCLQLTEPGGEQYPAEGLWQPARKAAHHRNCSCSELGHSKQQQGRDGLRTVRRTRGLRILH